ncbi:DUF4143 domain-containing protein [bacterium]|nr:DUF4143 domain-containing protein [bacterium]
MASLSPLLEKKWHYYSQGSYNLYYWRTKSGTEIDFIVYGNDGFWAVEVKNKKEIRDKDLRPLIRFHQDYPECQPIFVYRGTEKLHTHNILCIPCESFLKSLNPEKPLPLVSKK